MAIYQNTKITIIGILLLMTPAIYSQVTIGSGKVPEEFSVLEIVSSQIEGGLRLPHLNSAQKTKLTTKIQTSANSTEAQGLVIFNTEKKIAEYWDGDQWIELKSGAASWLKSDSETPTIPTNNTDNIYQMGSVSVGTDTTDKSAILQIVAQDKGVLFPNITLIAQNDQTTIPNPRKGLLVYNTGANANMPVAGYMYWDGSNWRLFVDSPTIKPNIAAIVKENVVLLPSTYVQDVPFAGTMEVPYTGGNGGAYSAESQYGGANTVNFHGLTFKLQPGVLAMGNGKLVYDVAGTPTVSSPTITTPPVMFLGNSWGFVEIGKTDTNAKIETRSYVGPMVATTGGAEFSVTTLDGRFSLRFFATTGQTLDLTDIQMKYNGAKASDNIMINHSHAYAGGSSATAYNNFLLDKNWKTNGDADVYFGGAPEYRQLVFTATDTSKRIYRYSFFFGAQGLSFNDYPTSKCWIFAEEISSE